MRHRGNRLASPTASTSTTGAVGFVVPDLPGGRPEDEPPEEIAAVTRSLVAGLLAAFKPPAVETGLRDVPRITIAPEVERMLHRLESTRRPSTTSCPPPRATARARASIGRRSPGTRRRRRTGATRAGPARQSDDGELADQRAAGEDAARPPQTSTNRSHAPISASSRRSHSPHTGRSRSASLRRSPHSGHRPSARSGRASTCPGGYDPGRSVRTGGGA